MTKKANIGKQMLSRRDFIAASIAAGTALGLGASTALLSAPAQAAEPKKGGVLKLGIGGGSTTDPLDPALGVSTAAHLLCRQWGDTLVTLEADRKLSGRLAESFSANADGSEWTFIIREGVKFHDGTDLTPEDVVATLERHANKDSKSVVLPLMSGISAIKADGRNVRISLSSPNADLPYLLTDYHLAIQPKGKMGEGNTVIGTGPYKIVSAEPGIRYVLEKHKSDWNANRGYYDGLEIIIINDSSARNSALQSGQVHMINRVEPKVAKLLSRLPGVEVVNTVSRRIHLAEMMVDRAPFDNKDLRLALKYSINRQQILDNILEGYGSIGNDFPINEAYPFYEKIIEQRPFDLEKAAEHYKASGHDGSPIELFVADTAFPGAVDMTLLWQQTARQAGIPLTIKKMPDDGYWSNVWLVEPFTMDNINGRPVQDQLYSTFFKTGAPWNGSHFANSEFDALLLEARAELDQKKRTDIYGKMAQILWEEGGVVIPVFADFIDAHTKDVGGWMPNSNGELMGGMAPSETWFQ